MVPVAGEEFGTGDMKPVPGASSPHAGFIDVENMRSVQEFPDALIHFRQVLGALPHGRDHGCPAQRASEQVGNQLTDPIIRQQLVDAGVDQECLQVGAILHGMRRLGGKCSPVGRPAMRTPFVFRTVLGHDNPEGRNVMNLTPFHSTRLDVFQGCPTRGTDGNGMDNDRIRDGNGLKAVAFVSFLAARRSLAFLPRRLGSAKPILRRRATAIPAVLVQPGFEVRNPGLQASILVTEFGDDTLLLQDDAFEIVDGCEKSRDIRNGVVGRRAILNILLGRADIRSH